MPGYLPTDIRNLLVTEMTLLVPLLPSDIYIPNRGSVEVVLDELPKGADDVFEGGTRNEQVVLVFRVKEGSQGGQQDGASVQVPDFRTTVDHLHAYKVNVKKKKLCTFKKYLALYLKF